MVKGLGVGEGHNIFVVGRVRVLLALDCVVAVFVNLSKALFSTSFHLQLRLVQLKDHLQTNFRIFLQLNLNLVEIVLDVHDLVLYLQPGLLVPLMMLFGLSEVDTCALVKVLLGFYLSPNVMFIL